MTTDIASAKIIQLLLVEDSDTDFLLLERQMQKMLAPIEITRAANRAELIVALQHDYDLIITDFHLPDIEGEGLLATIAAAHNQTPCLLLSGSSAEFNSIQAPPTVFAKLEKGNNSALRAAIQQACLAIGIAFKE